MFGIGMPEMIVILTVALIVIGPKKLPDLARALGRAFGEFRRAVTDLKETINVEPELKEARKALDSLNDPYPPIPPAKPSPKTADSNLTSESAETQSPSATVPGSTPTDKS